MPNEIFEEERAPGRRRSSRYASTALFAGSVALVSSVALVGGVIGIGAIGLGIRGLREIRDARGGLRGEGMAVGGIVLGILALVGSGAVLVLYLCFPALLRARH